MPFLQTNIQSVMEQNNTLNIKYVEHHAWKSAVLLYFFAEQQGNSSTTQEHEIESHVHKNVWGYPLIFRTSISAKIGWTTCEHNK